MPEKIFNQSLSAASERNKAPILAALSSYLKPGNTILEVGSSTAQHANYFTQHLDVIWQCSEQASHLKQLKTWLNDTIRLLPAIALDVNQYAWETKQYDAVFTANTLHVMNNESYRYFLNQVHYALKANGKFIIYGPIHYSHKPLSPSNCDFNRWLSSNFRDGGIRSLNEIKKILNSHKLNLLADIDMPANNQLLIWQK